jgi:hypothetical protein
LAKWKNVFVKQRHSGQIALRWMQPLRFVETRLVFLFVLGCCYVCGTRNKNLAAKRLNILVFEQSIFFTHGHIVHW